MTLTLKISVLMPQLQEGYELSQIDQDRWARMERRLTGHEEGHVQIARAGARRIIAAARRAPCNKLARILEAEWSRLGVRQTEYDRLTNHGATQEAWEALQIQ